MALSGLDIFKLLPKTNCGDCHVPTCLAFAMALATKKTSLDKCPHVSAESKAALEGAAAPPIQLVTIGAGENKLEIGNETVLFRHEQTFYHPTGLAVEIGDNLPLSEIEKKAKYIQNLVFDRVGKKARIELIAIRDVSHNPDAFANACKTVTANSTLALVQISSEPTVQEAGLKVTASRRPLIYGADARNYQAMAELAKKYNCPLGVTGNNLDELADLTPKITALGVKELVINPNSKTMGQLLADITQIRRLGLKKNFRPLGFPVIVFSLDGADAMSETLFAATFVLKYAGIVVIKHSELWEALALATVRQNIYTDPQKPIQMEAKAYPIGKVTDQSPVLLTTNFSLTYFTVEPEVEASKIPAYILVVNTEGMSVLTAYAADKFNEKIIAKAIKESDIGQKVSHKQVILPGYVAALSGKLESESGWEVLVGPREASAIPAYLKNIGSR
jgi:acetyl-CoA decarbonylase/synthase complex subunit gamma